MSGVSLFSYSPLTPSAICEPGSSVHYSISGNRLCERPGGKFEVIPKSPVEVIGERILLPLIQRIWQVSVYGWQAANSGCAKLDQFLFGKVQWFPGADGAPTDKKKMEDCLAAPIEQIVIATQHGVSLNNPKLIEAAEGATRRLLKLCVQEDSYNKVQLQLSEDLKQYEQEHEKVKKVKYTCEKENPGYKCYLSPDNDRKPSMKAIKDGDGILQWILIKGYKCWSMYVDGTFYNSYHDGGGFNCRTDTGQPSVQDDA